MTEETKKYKKDDVIKPIALALILGVQPQQIFSMTKNGTLPKLKNDEGKQVVKMGDVLELYSKKADRLRGQLAKVEGLLSKIS